MRPLLIVLFWMVSSAFFSGCSDGRGPRAGITLSTCLQDLTNVMVFARAPAGRAGMISTYDRSGGNNDWAQWPQPGPDGLIDIAKLTGPGCVNRIWMTSVPAEQWLFFFDGEPEPRIRVSSSELFGGRFPFLPPVSGYKSGGSYCYLPLPFARSLRIAVRVSRLGPDSRPYYQINYTSYDKRTVVESFPREMSPAETNLVAEVCRAWKEDRTGLRAAAGSCVQSRRVDLDVQAKGIWLDHAGPGMITTFVMKPVFPADTTALRKARALREVVLRFYWDGRAQPSVEAPLGDFFCNAFHRREYGNLAMGYLNGTYACRFPMPFRKSARAELANDGPTPVSIEVSYAVEPLQASGVSRYFHACWNSSVARGMPHPVLRATGKGHYVGCYLNAIGTDGTWNILEGDDMIWVDGEESPSLHGTGLEDYFNGAWYYFGLFDLPLHGLVEKSAMRTDQYRLHLPDRVAFSDRISVNFEFGDANRAGGYMSSTAYWYQSVPTAAGSSIPSVAERFPVADRLEPLTVMAQLFELERIGHFAEARDRCLEYAEKFAFPALAGVLRLRAAAYTEAIGDMASAQAVFRQIETAAPETPAGKQAKALLWFHENAGSALLGTQINAGYRVYLDGKSVGEGDNPLDIAVSAVTLTPGEHELAAEVAQTRPDAWFSLHLRMHGTNLVSDAAWERTHQKPSSWPNTLDDKSVVWTKVAGLGLDDMLPRMSFWQLSPNAFVNMQSGMQLVRPWQGLDTPARSAPVFLRKRFVVPERPR